MGVIVTFDYALWIARYPEFTYSVGPPASGVPGPLAQAYFEEATLYQRNDGSLPIYANARALMLLNMLTAHIAKLNATVGGVAPSPLVGRISNASEGSVSVGTQFDVPPGTAQWYAQTPYGAAWWTATAAFRTMHYRPGYGRYFGPTVV